MTTCKLQVNAEPLRLVENRIGDGGSTAWLQVCRRTTRAGKTVAASIHRVRCPQAPVDGGRRSDGSSWSVVVLPGGTEVDRAVAEIEESSGIITSASCTRCGGWTTFVMICLTPAPPSPDSAAPPFG